jgi:hypothetical protein
VGRRTLQERFDGLNRTTPVTATVPIQVLVKLEGLAAQLGLTPGQAAGEAIGQWVVRREQSLNRQARLTVEQAMREAMDKRPIEELLERFRGQMEACGQGATAGNPQSSAEGLQSAQRLCKVPGMESSNGTAGREDQDAIQVTTRLSMDTYHALKALAHREGRTMSAQVRRGVDKMLAEQERVAA